MRDEIARHGVSALLRRRNIVVPDRRSLRGYNVTDDEYESLAFFVRANEGFVWKKRDCGALVLVLAEWTYRHAARFSTFWLDAFKSLELVFTDAPNVFYERLEEGLDYWERPPKHQGDWMATLVAEGGFPRNLDIAGLDDLLDQVFSSFSWSFLASAATKPQHVARVTQEILRRKESSGFAVYATESIAPIIAKLAACFAAYRRDLDSPSRPKEEEPLTSWFARLHPANAPQRRLPIRDPHDSVFATLLYPRLRSGVEAGGYVQRFRESAPRFDLPKGLVAQLLGHGAEDAVLAEPVEPATNWPTPVELPTQAAPPEQSQSLAIDFLIPEKSPIGFSIMWRPDERLPVLRVQLPTDGLPTSWINEQAPNLGPSTRIALGPTGLLALAKTLELTGDAFKAGEEDGWTWPFPDVRGRALCFSRRSLKGVAEQPTSIVLPGQGFVVVDPQGRVQRGRDLESGVDYRIWLSQSPRQITGTVERLSSTTFRVRGADGDCTTFETDEDRIDFTFHGSPLSCELIGRRWTSSGALGPYIGIPTLFANTDDAPEVRTGMTSPQRMRGGPKRFEFPFAQPASRVRAFVRAGAKRTELRFSYVPTGTTFRLHPPSPDGKRIVSVSSPGLNHVRVVREKAEVSSSPAELGQQLVRVQLPPIIERERYRLELRYAGDEVVVAPLWDVRRTFRLDLGGESLTLADERTDAPTVERSIARYACVVGDGLRPDERVELHIRSSNRGRRFERERVLRAGLADADGNVEIRLAGIVDDLEPCARHQLSFRVSEDARRFEWRVDVDDTIFASEPEIGETYGRLAVRSQLRAPFPSWGYVPASQQWKPIQHVPMVEVMEGWRAPDIEVPPGGLLAAPFDGDYRIGYVRHIPGPQLVTDDALSAALATPRGFDLSTLRTEFAASRDRRERLRSMLLNLSAFNAAGSLTVPTVCSADGALLAYVAMRDDSGVGADGSLRAIPLGAWLRAARAVVEDEGRWIPMMFGCGAEALLLILMLRCAGLPVMEPDLSQLQHFESNLATRRPSRGRAQTEPGEIDVHARATLFDYEQRLPTLLDDWRRGDRAALREHSIDPELVALGIVPAEVREYLTHRYQGIEHFVEAPLALASAAARATLDPALDASVRRSVRVLISSQRQVRAWDRFEPLVGTLYLFCLVALWRSLRDRMDVPERARELLEQIEVQ